MRVLLKSLLFAGIVGLLVVGVAGADPIDVHLTSLPDWEQAELVPVPEWNEGLEGLHPGQAEAFRPPQLYVLDELVTPEGDFDSHPGLLMAWGDPADQGDIISAWELILPEDPDFTNMCITLTAWPRTGMTSISFSLKDIFGVMKGWRWPVGAGGLPMNAGTTLTINASGGPGQAGSTGYWNGGIDLTQVISFEFNESGIAQGGIPLPNNLPGFFGQWNYWHDIIVSPCPMPRPDHYSCYKIKELSDLPPIFLYLRDQFTEEDAVLVRKTKEICAPVDKNGEGITDPRTHLVCYEVQPKQKANARVLVTNQFGQQELEVKDKMRRLCVPSIKEHLE